MNSLRIIGHGLRLVILLAMQVFVMHSLVLFDTGFCFIYLAFLLFLPIQMPPVLLLLLGFVTGFTLDLFYDTGGIHAAATVLLAYLRPYILLLLTPRDGYDQNDSVNLHIMGWRWFLVYSFILIFFHHLIFFFLELAGIKLIGFTLSKVVVSTLFTGMVMIIIQLLFFSRRRSSR
ncbi:hypothetical protein HUW48_02450 [Adhaeribacter radiodurans]|uniref:Rod shape-determining protein MreD n=2 Tax=Adhaeribacter radiodurans TaxID=2745197 RepID=A0A7L7L2H2_9BACT|nr:hypothetical protein HUW48_02450 [Adhaeribacter radiodurans]